MGTRKGKTRVAEKHKQREVKKQNNVPMCNDTNGSYGGLKETHFWEDVDQNKKAALEVQGTVLK